MEKIFSHAWRGRHGCETKEELEQLQERQTTPEEIQGQFIDDDQVLQLVFYQNIVQSNQDGAFDINYRVCSDAMQWILRWWCTSSARMVPPNYDTRISSNSWRTCNMRCWSWSFTNSAKATTRSTNWISRKSCCATRISNPTSKLINYDILRNRYRWLRRDYTRHCHIWKM